MITVGVCSPMTSGRSSGCSRSSTQSREQAPRLRGVAHVGARDARLQLVEQIERRIGASVGLQEGDLEILVELVADFRADEGAGDRAAGALQAALQLGHPAAALGCCRPRREGSRWRRRKQWRRSTAARAKAAARRSPLPAPRPRAAQRLSSPRARQRAMAPTGARRAPARAHLSLAEEELADVGVQPVELARPLRARLLGRRFDGRLVARSTVRR